MQVESLGWEYPLDESMATHSSIIAWRIPMDRGAWRAAVHGVPKSWTRLSTGQHHFYSAYCYTALSFFFNIYFYLFIWLCQVSAAACGIWFPPKGMSLGPLHWSTES